MLRQKKVKKYFKQMLDVLIAMLYFAIKQPTQEVKQMDQWKSIGLYEHPARQQAGTFGNVVLSTAGVYTLRVGGSTLSCPQGWATKIHKDEAAEKESAIIIRNVPESIRRDLKATAALEDKSMQGLILELITRYVSK